MNFIYKHKGVVLVALMLVGVIFYSARQQNQPSEANTIKIGVISILSGQFASIGENYVRGVQLAAEEFNTKSNNVKVELFVEDDGYDPKKGISAYKKLTAIDHIDGLVNVSTATIDAVHADINNQKLPTVQFGIQNDGVADDYIFQITPSPESIIRGFAEYLKEHLSLKKVAVVYENATVFENFHKTFLKTYGAGTLTSFKVSGKDDIQIFASDIVNQKFDGVVILTMPETGALLVKKISSLTKTPPQYMIDAQLSTGEANYKNILGSLSPLNGAYSVWLADSDNSAFKKNYVAKFKTEPGTFADTGYDAFNSLVNAYDTDTHTWASNLQKTNAIGATGKIVFDQVGVRSQDLEIKRVKDGAIVTEARIGIRE